MKSAARGKSTRVPSAYAEDLAKYELIDLYLKDGEFSSELGRILRKHDTVLTRLLNSPHDPGVMGEAAASDLERQVLETLRRDAPRFYRSLQLTTIIGDLERMAADRHVDVENLLPDRFPPDCVDGVLELAADIRTMATRFGLDYPWAVPRLLKYVIATKDTGEDEAIKSLWPLMPIHVFGSLARSIERPALLIRLPAAFVLLYSESQIIKMMRQLLHAYKQKLKKEGFPLDTKDAFSKQLGWVFAHKRHALSAKQISSEIEWTVIKSENGETHDIGLANENHVRDVLRKWGRMLDDPAYGNSALKRQRQAITSLGNNKAQHNEQQEKRVG